MCWCAEIRSLDVEVYVLRWKEMEARLRWKEKESRENKNSDQQNPEQKKMETVVDILQMVK